MGQCFLFLLMLYDIKPLKIVVTKWLPVFTKLVSVSNYYEFLWVTIYSNLEKNRL